MQTEFKENRWFWGFASLHVIFWTILPIVLRYTLPLDAIEGTTWGRQLAFGYDKNPFLNAWLSEFAVWIGGQSGWAIYFLGQLSIVAAFWAVWRLARKFVSPVHAFLAVVILEFITNYNVDAMDFDDNVLQVCFWALLILFFYKAVTNQKIRDWILVGLFAALAMLSKYFVLVLFVPMAIFLFTHSEARKSFSKAGLYIAIALFCVLMVPHVIWLFHHDFMPVKYMFARTGTSATWINHLWNPWYFAYSYLLAFIIPSLIFLIVYPGKKMSPQISTTHKITSFQWQFLWWMGAAPFVFVLLLSLISGMALHLGWGQPLMSFWGLILVAATQPMITRRRFYRFLSIAGFLWLIFMIGYSSEIVEAGSSSSANYPGPILAQAVTKAWHDKYHTKLNYIIGPRFEAGVVSLYSSDRPAVYIEHRPKVSFWINEATLRRDGAIVIWDMDQGGLAQNDILPVNGMIDQTVITVPWMRTGGKKLVRLGIAFVEGQASGLG